MPNQDTFSEALKDDIRRQGLTLEKAADRANMGIRQFHRHIKGENKGGIMPLDTVVELRREGLMSKETAQRYLEIIRLELLLKKKKKPRTKRSRLPRTLYRKRNTA